MNDTKINLAAVCGSEVRVYGPVPDDGGRRPLMHIKHFPHYGAAKVWAEDHDTHQRQSKR